MKNDYTPLPVTRRDFLRASGGALGVLAMSRFAPSLLAQTALSQTPRAERDQRILVLIQLAGGNDGLNTVVPFQDDNYYRLRPNLGIPENQLLPLTDGLGLNPACEPLQRLFGEGRLSILQNVGYPNPNRSHFRSSEIWETASKSDETAHSGWLGRYFDNYCMGHDAADPLGVHISNDVPQVFAAEEPHNVFGLTARGSVAGREGMESRELLEELTQTELSPGNAGYLQHTMMDALVTEKRVQELIEKYRPMASYGNTSLEQSLKRVAALIAGGMETRVYFVSQGGYDTHANQSYTHAQKLGELSKALAAFQQDIEQHRLQEQVLTMTFSEFGRRPSENASGGTDHGTAAPLFIVGGQVGAGLIGKAPNLNLKKNEDLQYDIDFRAVYATVIEQWFQADPVKVLGEQHETLNLLAT